MEKQNDSIRERLLARMPQPDNLAAYREETASLLAKHEKALFWEKMPAKVCSVAAIAILVADWLWERKIGAAMDPSVWFGVGVLAFAGAVLDLRYRIYRSRVDTLKEVKQVQLQILEIQSSLQKPSSE